MPKRKHRGGPSDRSSPRHSHADSQSPSRYQAGDAPTGKPWAKPKPKFGAKSGPQPGSRSETKSAAKPGPKTASRSGDGRGRSQSDKAGWAGKAPRGSSSSFHDRSGPRSDQLRGQRRPQGAVKSSFKATQAAAAPPETSRED